MNGSSGYTGGMKDLTRSEALKTLLGFFVLSACKDAAKTQVAASGAKASSANSQSSETPQPSSTQLPTDSLTQISTNTTCPTGLTKFSLAQLKAAPDELAVTARWYGYGQSALLAFKLPKFEFNTNFRGNLSSFYLVAEDGRPIAFKTITPSLDALGNGLMGIQFLDHLPVREKSKLAFVFNYNNENCVSPLLGPISFEQSFRGLPVQTMRQSLSLAQMMALDPVPQIPEDALNLDKNLIIASNASTTYNVSSALSGCVLCDLLGNQLAAQGETFKDFGKYPVFIAYKRTSNGYTRFFIRLV